MSIPQLPEELINKILYEFKGFQPYPFLKEFKDIIDNCLEPENIEKITGGDITLDEVKSREWILSQFQDENSFYYDDLGDLTENILRDMYMMKHKYEIFEKIEIKNEFLIINPLKNDPRKFC